MITLQEVHVRPRAVDRFEPVVGPDYLDFVRREVERLHLRFHGFFEGEPGSPDAHAGRRALGVVGRSEPAPDAVLLLRDSDMAPSPSILKAFWNERTGRNPRRTRLRFQIDHLRQSQRTQSAGHRLHHPAQTHAQDAPADPSAAAFRVAEH